MMDKSQTPLNKQLLLKNRCKYHPQLDLDTICFNQTCREKGQQIICSYCGQQKPHVSHIYQQYPIYKTSPGFRLINLEEESSNLPKLAESKQSYVEKIADFKVFVLQLINKMSNQHIRKIQCFNDFLKKNSVFKICNNLRHNWQDHQHCCLEMVNFLKDLQKKRRPKSQISQLIQQKILQESLFLTRQIEQLTIDLNSIFQKYQNRSNLLQPISLYPHQNVSSFQRLFQQAQEKQQKNNASIIASSQKHINNMHNSKINKKTVEEQHNQYQNIQIEDNNDVVDVDKQNMQCQYKSLINELLVFDKQPNHQNLQIHEPSILTNKENIRKTIGFDIEQNDTVIVWDGSPLTIQSLPVLINTQHLIIQDPSLGNEESIRKMLKTMPSLKGIHLHCQNQISSHLFKYFNLQYLSLYPNYRFIQLIDRSKYFPKIQRTMLDHLPKNFLRKYNNNKIKTAYITSERYEINTFIEEVNFIQDQSQIYWKFKKPMITKLLTLDNLLILVFSNIQIGNISFKEIYQKYPNLHTLVFDDCDTDHNNLADRFKYLRQDQLKHLQISGDSLDNKIMLNDSSVYEIFRFICLQTLILTNVEVTQQFRMKQTRVPFKAIQKLSHLTHLNLFNSWPVFSSLPFYLHPKCKKNLKFLNIGCSQIQIKRHSMFFKIFPKLQTLSIDYTQMGEMELLSLMKQRTHLQYLSIQNLNGQPIKYERMHKRQRIKFYGSIRPQFFKNLQLKILKYINICIVFDIIDNCHSFSSYLWQGYDKLQCIRINQGLLTKQTMQHLQKRGIKILVEANSQFCAPTIGNTINISQQAISSTHNQHLQNIFMEKASTFPRQDIDKNILEDEEVDATDSSLLINEEKGQKNISKKFLCRTNRPRSQYYNDQDMPNKTVDKQREQGVISVSELS